jgi:homeobox protein cut-like
MDGLKSPLKMEDSPHFPMQIHHSPMGLPLPLPLSVPPLMSTGRIPKSDPMEGRLQDMLRYNMEKYSGQALDTLGTSRRVRELLSIHNIGQRLFAKYVLGLSQGTVSELLSKPKSWEKLTEKGRDSYRKMHAWAYDEQAVMLLKSLIPRKGELVRTTSAGPSLIMKGKEALRILLIAASSAR